MAQLSIGMRRTTLGLTLGLTLALPAAAELREVTFEFFPSGDAAQGHPIRMVVEADVDREGRPLEAPAPPPAPATVERFLADYIGALRAGPVDAALPFWLAAERDATRGRLAPVFDQQKGLFETVTQSRLHTQLRYGRFLVAAVRHQRSDGAEPLVAMYPLVETGGGWALSNALNEDPMFQILYFSFQDGIGLDHAFKTIN